MKQLGQNELTLEILEWNYLEHFKSFKDACMVLPLGHPRRVLLERETNLLQSKINTLKQKLK